MEENKRLAYAIFLSILAVFIYTQLFAPLPVKTIEVEKEVEVATNKGAQSTSFDAQVQNQATSTAVLESVNNALAKKNAFTPTDKDYEKSSVVRVENLLFRAEITLLGGRLKSLYLKKHKKELNDNNAINLVTTSGVNLPLGIQVSGLKDDGVTYAIQGVSDNSILKDNRFLVTEVEEFNFKLSGILPNGKKIEKVFKFTPLDYHFNLDVKLKDTSSDGSDLKLFYPNFHPISEASKNYNPLMIEALTLENSIEREALPERQSDKLSVNWFGLGDNYFATYIVPARKSTANGRVVRDNDNVIMEAYGNSNGGEFIVFTGAKEHDIILTSDYGFHRSVDLGWFGFIGQPILSCIKFLNKNLGNYGLAIVLFTILLKALLLPFTKTSFVSMQKMQDLQPEMKALRERVTDQTKLQQEMMALYKKHNVNPLGGCLPMLAQIPIFLGMYNALRVSIDLRHSPFALWINDLAAPERLDVLGIPVPVMIILMGASMFLQQFTIPSSADPAQRKMMLIMPIVFTIMFIIFPFPAGLVLYWLTNNLISITQQMALRTEKRITPFQATGVAGVAIFGFAFILTLL